MTPGFAARRRAEEFNSLVESPSAEGSAPTRHADLLELVETLREAPQVEPRAEFVADLRRQLMTEAASVLTPTAARLSVVPRRNPRERRIAIAVGAFAVVSATTSMAMAAQTALPGETLYPLKRALEDASTTIKVDEDAKGASLLAHAAGRLDEVNELTRQGEDSNDQAVTDTLHAFTDQASSASDLMIAAYADKGQKSDIEELRTFAAQSIESLDELEAVVPDASRAALIEAAQVINQIDSTAIRLCPSCGEGGVAEVPALAPASVDDLLADLGSALAGPASTDPGKTRGDAAPAGGSTRGNGKTRGQGDADPDAPIEFPEPVTDEPAGDGDNGGDTVSGGNGNVIDALTDKLTGGDNEGPRPTQGNLADETVDGLLGGLLGK
ncbi:MAG: DUF5667 domain-containing protein [Actinomycetota bacterium]|nr:DUF5667 domain-containing protein [Actinomycetota bacterium]